MTIVRIWHYICELCLLRGVKNAICKSQKSVFFHKIQKKAIVEWLNTSNWNCLKVITMLYKDHVSHVCDLACCIANGASENKFFIQKRMIGWQKRVFTPLWRKMKSWWLQKLKDRHQFYHVMLSKQQWSVDKGDL